MPISALDWMPLALHHSAATAFCFTLHCPPLCCPSVNVMCKPDDLQSNPYVRTPEHAPLSKRRCHGLSCPLPELCPDVKFRLSGKAEETAHEGYTTFVSVSL